MEQQKFATRDLIGEAYQKGKQELFRDIHDKLRFDILCKDCVTNLQFIEEIKQKHGLK